MRKAHLLKPTKANTRPGSVIFLDTETLSVDQTDGSQRLYLKLGWAVHCRTVKGQRLKEQSWLEFTRSGSFWDWLNPRARPSHTTYLVAHNITVDLAVSDGFKELAARGWILESFYTKGLTSIFRWRNGKRKLVGIDNTNLFPGSLERWGRIVGLPKGHVDFDTVSDRELSSYCHRDVEIMVKCWRVWLDFLDLHDLGSFRFTVASTALNAWRHRFMPCTVHIHSDPRALELERQAYHGGRVECFWRGSRSDGPFYYMDVNSMYGHVLTRYYYPAGLVGYTDQDDLSLLGRKINRYSVIARVLIDTSIPWYPVKKGSNLIYPVGQFWTTLTTPEITQAAQDGSLRAVSGFAWYRQAPLFGAFVNLFTGLRRDYKSSGNDGYAEISKLLVNSLYGKFGQSGYDQKRIGSTNPDDIWSSNGYDIVSGQHFRQFALAGGVYESRKTGEAFNSFPAIAAHVTAFARLYLYRLIRKIPSGHAFYCDTDSIIVDELGYQALTPIIDPHRLGMLKVEHTGPDLEVWAPKDYRLGDRVKTKGISKNAVLIEPDTYTQDQWSRLDGLIHQGNLTGARIQPVTKHLNRSIVSGVVGPEGWIEPFCLALEDAQAEPLPLPLLRL